MSESSQSQGSITGMATGPSGPVHPLDGNLLRRYGAKILNPVDAVPDADGKEVLPTVYRTDRLLVPGTLLDDPDFQKFLRATLEKIRLGYEEPQRDPQADGRMYWPIRLIPLPQTLLDRPIDAWYALQALRIAAGYDNNPKRKDQVDQVSLSHLLFATTARAHSLLGSPGGFEGHHDDGTGRRPVYVPLSDPPNRTTWSSERRPVVAVLDTGCGQHRWLERAPSPDPFVFWDSRVLPPPPPEDDPERNTNKLEPLLGEVDSHSGHGTFITGILRQLAPHCRVLCVPLMHHDGVVDEDELDRVLWRLEYLVRTAQTNPATMSGDFVDIVLMAFGGYYESFRDLPALRGPLQALSGLGVTLVASVGNDASPQPMYPAAFQCEPWATGFGTVVGVGALARPNVTAIYSNEGYALKHYPGYAIVSTLPRSCTGSHAPRLLHSDVIPSRESYDPDGSHYGFGTWSGTSFSAAICAALLAKALYTTTGLRPLNDIQPAAARARAQSAIGAIGEVGVP